MGVTIQKDGESVGRPSTRPAASSTSPSSFSRYRPEPRALASGRLECGSLVEAEGFLVRFQEVASYIDSNSVLIVIFGVTGVGKTTIGRLVAHELGVPFYDADDFHSRENRQKMTAGVPLSERDRKPWLRSLARLIPSWEAAGGAVLACSALRKQHREILREASDDSTVFVFLNAAPETIRARLARRHDHFMSPHCSTAS